MRGKTNKHTKQADKENKRALSHLCAHLSLFLSLRSCFHFFGSGFGGMLPSNQENPGFSRFPPTFDLGLSSDLLPSELVLLDPGSTGPQDLRNSGLDRTIPLYHAVRCCSVFCVLCSVRTYVQYCTVVLCSTAVPALVSSHKKHRQRNLIGHAHLLSNIIHPTQHRFI